MVWVFAAPHVVHARTHPGPKRARIEVKRRD